MNQFITRLVFLAILFAFFVSCTTKAEEKVRKQNSQAQYETSDLLKQLKISNDSKEQKKNCEHYCKVELPAR